MKKATLRLLTTFCLVVLGIGLHAQEKKTVSGVIQDAKGAELAGATVSEKGTPNRILSDQKGSFSIKVAPNATLVVSFIGFVTKEISASSAGVSTISLEANTSALNEVVVTGFGETRAKKTLGYAVTQISGDDITRT